MAFHISYCVLILCSLHLCEGITKCDKKSSCSCMGDNGMVDLTPLTGNPKFKDVTANTGDKFSWNPCTAFTEGDCKNVAACQVQGGNNYFSIGTQDSAKFEVKSGALTVSYSEDSFLTTGNLTFLRTSIITLICDKDTDGKLVATGESPAGSGNYLMSLSSKYACEQSGGGGTITVSLSLSVGSILTLVLFIVLVVYLVAGASFQKFYRNADGREIMPNIVFWTSVPGLIREGVMFTVRCGKAGKTYDQI